MASAKLAHRPEPMDPQCRHDPQQELAIIAERMAELRARGILWGQPGRAPTTLCAGPPTRATRRFKAVPQTP